MDIESRRNVWNLLIESRRFKTILLSTHYLEEADAVSDRICIMSNGLIHCYGTPVFLKNIFGTGYQLRIAKKIDDFKIENRNSLDEFIKRYFKSSKKCSETQGEIIYLLNESSNTSCNENLKDGQLAKFFDEFELMKRSFAISSCGLSVTTLEDVFLRITTNDEFILDVQYDKNVTAAKRPLQSIDFGKSRKASNYNFENALMENITLTSYRQQNGLDLSNMTDIELNDSTMNIVDPKTDEIDNFFLLFLLRLKGKNH